MAPSVPAKTNMRQGRPDMSEAAASLTNQSVPPDLQKAWAALATAQAEALKGSQWVGRNFAEEARKMHYGEREDALIHGQASLEEAKTLIEEGVPIAPILLPVAPPEKLN